MLSFFLCSKPRAVTVKCDGCAYDVDVDEEISRKAQSANGIGCLTQRQNTVTSVSLEIPILEGHCALLNPYKLAPFLWDVGKQC